MNAERSQPCYAPPTLGEDWEYEQDNLPNSDSAAFKSYFNIVNRNYTNPVTPAKNTNACENQQMGKARTPSSRGRKNALGITSGKTFCPIFITPPPKNTSER